MTEEQSSNEINFNPDLFTSETETELSDYSFTQKATGKNCYLKLECLHGENQFIEAFVSRVVWPAASTLGRYFCDIMDESFFLNKKVVEVGSGTGLCGCVVALLGAAEVVLTDGCDESVRIIDSNIERNSLNEIAHAEKLPWGETLQESLSKNFDICIGTDIIYETEMIKPLFSSVHQLLRPSGIFYLANHVHRFAPLRELVLAEAKSLKFELLRTETIGDDIELCILKRE